MLQMILNTITSSANLSAGYEPTKYEFTDEKGKLMFGCIVVEEMGQVQEGCKGSEIPKEPRGC